MCGLAMVTSNVFILTYTKLFNTRADLESFVKSVPTLTTFLFELMRREREDVNITQNGPSSTRQRNAIIKMVQSSHSTKVKEFEIKILQKITQLIWSFFHFDFNSEQLTTINHSSRQENLHNNACVG